MSYPRGASNGREPAFASDVSSTDGTCGLTKREYMATAILAASIARPDSQWAFVEVVQMADALLAALEEPLNG